MEEFSPEMKRSIIMDNYENPRNRGLIENDYELLGYKQLREKSNTCIDDITMQVKIIDDKIEDIRFDGVACAITTSTTSVMIGLLMDKSKEEAKYIIDEYNKMLKGESYDIAILEEANVFNETYKQAARIKCATISWVAIEKLLNGNEGNKV